MADVKISGLPASTVPLAGTEVLPIVQGGQTRQVSVNNLTAGKDIAGLGLTLTSTDAGAGQAPTVDLYRNSASPAASDTIGEVEFNGKDSAGNKQAYALLHGSILSPTSGAEQGQLHFETATAGALTEKMIIGTTNLVINDPGNIFNVRIEGDTDANLFYTDATNSRVGVGTISPSTKLDVNGTVTATAFAGPLNGTVGATTATTGKFTTLEATGVTTVQAGTALLPAITTTGDTNTGIFFPAADTIAFTEGGAESMRIDSNQNLLVGTTTSPTGSGNIRAKYGFVQDNLAVYSGNKVLALSTATNFATYTNPNGSVNMCLKIRVNAYCSGGAADAYCGESSEWIVNYNTYGGIPQTPTLTRLNNQAWQPNAFITATYNLTASLSGNTMTLTATQTLSGAGAAIPTGANFTYRIENVMPTVLGCVFTAL